MIVGNYKAVLIDRIDISDVIKVFKFEKPKDFNYVPGHYLSLIPPENKRRSYSFSSAPHENVLEIITDVFPMGVGSKFLLSLTNRDVVSFYGPIGLMVLPDDYIKVPAFNFICTGTGVAPFKSMIKYLIGMGYKGEIKLLYSEKYKKDFIDINIDARNYTEYKTITRESVSDYLEGRVTEHLDKLAYVNGAMFYVCGKLDMILEVTNLLRLGGVDTKNIKTESFYV